VGVRVDGFMSEQGVVARRGEPNGSPECCREW
jgi:hypothetical protein